MAKLILSHNADVNVKGMDGITALHIASEKGDAQIVEDLLNHGACVNSVYTSGNRKGFAPLHLADGDMIVKLLLSKGADIEAKTEENLTPLYVATTTGRENVVKHLLECGANVDAQNNESNRGSFIIAVHGYGEKYRAIVGNLLDYGFTVNPADADDPTLLHAAVEKGYLKIVKDLLTYGSDVNMLYNSKYQKGHTLLHTAADEKQEEVAKLLINHGAIVNVKDRFDRTPIFIAINNSDLNITKLLLNNGAEIKDAALLNTAVKKHCPEIIDILLQHDADINASDENGKTALYLAAENARNRDFMENVGDMNRADVVKLLLSRGADVNIKEKGGNTPLHIAAEYGHIDFVEMLLEFGADVDSKGKNGRTALHFAAEKGHIQVVEALLEYCSDINQNHGIRKFYRSRNYDSDDEYSIYSNRGFDDCDEVANCLNQHILKMKYANLYVNKQNLHEIGSTVKDQFWIACDKEMRTMKTEKISNSNIYFHDILMKSASQLALYARNENIVSNQFLKSNEFASKFPVYSDMINNYFRKGVVRKELLKHGNKSFDSLDCFPELPYNCVEKILSYLSDRDLRIFIGVPISINKDYVVTCYNRPKINDI